MASPPTSQINQLLDKMSNPDSDFRFMSLNDLLDHLTNNAQFTLSGIDSSLMAKVLDSIIKALSDQNGEVQNLAVKCLGPLVLKMRDNQIGPLLDRLTTLSMTSEDPSIPSTALRTVISNLPRPPSNASNNASTKTALLGSSQLAHSTVARQDASVAAIQSAVTAVQKTLLPKLLILLKPNEPGKRQGSATLDSVDLLVETVRCFGVIMTGAEVERLQVAVMNLLESDRSSGVIKKRAVTALSLLCVHAPDELLSSFISHLIESFGAQTKHKNPTKLRLLVSITGSLARGIPERFGPYLKSLCPFVLSVVDGKDINDRDLGDEPEMEMDEVREASLVALESFQSCCTEEMKRFTDDLLAASTVYLKYDPNYADPGSDEDDEMGADGDEGGDDDDGDFGGSDDEDAFEDDGNFSDEDDISWKVRRCAAKLLATVIITRASDLIRGADENGGRAYTVIAPLLIERFHEREENVRLEILATATSLVNKTGEISQGPPLAAIGSAPSGGMPPPPKKRRGSDASMLDSIAVPEPMVVDGQGVKTALAGLVPVISKSLGKLLNSKATALPTKQASITLLSAIVTTLHGTFGSSLSIFINALVDMAKGGSSLTSGGNVVVATAQGGSAATATGTSVRIEAIRLLGKIFENHSTEDIEQYLNVLVPAVSTAVGETGFKISFEALGTMIALCRLLTQPEAISHSAHLHAVHEVVITKIQNAVADLEVRERAILALGVILSQTAGNPAWLGQDRRMKSLEVLLERLKNETTRISAARAIEGVAKSTVTPEDVNPAWIQAVLTECGGQLRKANRTLRAASLDALKSIGANDYCRACLDSETKRDMINTLTPLIVTGDMQLLALALAVMRFMLVGGTGDVGITKDVIQAICQLIRVNLGTGAVLQNLLALVAVIGEVDVPGKQELMMAILKDVGVSGETNIVAKVIAQLMVSGGGEKGGFAVGVRQFVDEAEIIKDEDRKSLALIILGEIGLRMGPAFTVKPETFFSQLQAKGDNVPIAAAVALGLAGAGNVEGYLPDIMKRLSSGKDSYLLVHSLKEIIQHSSSDAIKSHATDMWNTLLSTAISNDDAKAAAAECVGRLTVLDPWSFLPELQKHLSAPQPAARGMVISALRYTFTDTDDSYDELLRPIVVDFLEAMLQDPELENRRLALTALNSAASNKAHLLAGSGLERLLPKVYSESVVKPELVREIQMGPFRHRVDDGLEVRKSAYETLYALLETSFWNIDLDTYFDRVIAGLGDEHDIRALANLMLAKLAGMAKDETLKRLDPIADAMRKVLSEKPKENAVKQELERHKEGVRGVIKVAIQLQNEVKTLVGSGGGAKAANTKWKGFYEWLWQGFQSEIVACEDAGGQ